MTASDACFSAMDSEAVLEDQPLDGESSLSDADQTSCEEPQKSEQSRVVEVDDANVYL